MFDLRTSANGPNVRHGGYAGCLTILSSSAPTLAQRRAGRAVSGFSWVALLTAGGSGQKHQTRSEIERHHFQLKKKEHFRNIFVINYIPVYNFLPAHITYHVWSNVVVVVSFCAVQAQAGKTFEQAVTVAQIVPWEDYNYNSGLCPTFWPQRGDVFTAMADLLLHYLFTNCSAKCWCWWSSCVSCDLACQVQVLQLLSHLSYRWWQMGGKRQQVGNNLSCLDWNQVSLKSGTKWISNVECRLFLWGR